MLNRTTPFRENDPRAVRPAAQRVGGASTAWRWLVVFPIPRITQFWKITALCGFAHAFALHVGQLVPPDEGEEAVRAHHARQEGVEEARRCG